MPPESERPTAAIGHVFLATPCLAESAEFLRRLGLRLIFAGEHVAVFELRGGTHLIARQQTDAAPGDATFDLMVDDLPAIRRQLLDHGYAPTPIEPRPAIDHQVFTVVAPGGTRITVYSSHASGQPV